MNDEEKRYKAIFYNGIKHSNYGSIIMVVLLLYFYYGIIIVVFL